MLIHRTPRNIIAIAISLLISFSATAENEKRTPIEAFRGTSYFQLLKCSGEAKIAFLKVELGELKELEVYSSISDCQKEARSELKKLFPKASATVAKKPSASKLLKDYYAACLAALDGISPGSSELKFAYEKRQDEAGRKVNEIWNRFEIEAGL